MTLDGITLQSVILGNTVLEWATALGIAIALNLAFFLAVKVALRQLERYAAKTTTFWDDALVAVLKKTRHTLVFVVTLYFGCRSLEIPERPDRILLGATSVAVFLQIGIWLNAVLSFYLVKTQERANGTDSSAATGLAALEFIARILIWSAILLLMLDNLGVNVTALVAGLGVGGIAVALAVQNILGDLFASLSIVMDKPFVVGDYIVIDTFMGTVERVGIKTTRIRSLSGEQVIFSNGDLLKSRLRNYKRMRERRALFGFGVVYETTAETMKKIPDIVRRIVEAQPQTRFERAHFKGFGESSLDFEVVYWMLDPDYSKFMDTQQAINLALMEEMAALKVGFAFPSRSLYLETPLRATVSIEKNATP